MAPVVFHTRNITDRRQAVPDGGRFKRGSGALRVAFWVSGAPKRLFAIIMKSGKARPKRLTLKLLAGFASAMILYFLFLWFTLPDISDPSSLIASQSSVITDRNGVELYRLFSEEDRTYIPGSSIPQHAKYAAIAIEDERFFERGCLDLRAITRAVLFLGRAGGGSTITRQLARNALGLRGENRFNRKLKELVLGCQLERKFSKEELLELYLNWIPFGQNAYGIEQASQVYFGMPAKDITLAQAAVLAALPQRPSYFSPYGKHLKTEVSGDVHQKVINREITLTSQIPDESITIGLKGAKAGTGNTTLYVGGRSDQVLQNMEDQGFISENERLTALSEIEKMKFQPSRENIRATHFILSVKEEIEEMFRDVAEKDLFEQGGLTIETTLDLELQKAAEKAVEFHRGDILNRFGAYNIALVSMDIDTHEILAYVGNTDYSDEEHGGKIDMAAVPRQPGSSFKPFVYASAFTNGYGPASVIYDVPTKIGDDEPRNFDGKFMGLITMRKALGASRNIPAAKTFFLAGGENEILALASAMGAPAPSLRREQLSKERGEKFEYGWPLALGAAETPLIEMVQAYGTFASGGEAFPAVKIRKVTDKKGNLLFQSEKITKKTAVLDPRIAYQITSVLSDESVRPNDYWKSQLTIPGFETAAKTGTSNKCLEWSKNKEDCLLRKPDNAWVIGYTPNLVTGVWTGNADSSAMYEKGDGLNTSSPVWKDFMISAHRIIKIRNTKFEIPDGIIRPQVSLLSGQLPTECTPVDLRKADIFLEENPPAKQDPACVVLEVDKLTHLLASEECPLEAREEGKFLYAHSMLAERWPYWEEGVQNWAKEQMKLWLASETHSGSLLPLPLAPSEKCDPALTPGRLKKPKLSIEFPKDGGIASYPAFKPQINFSVGSSVREVVFEIDGKNVARFEGTPVDRSVRVPRSVDKTGVHLFTVTLTDEYYNQVSASSSFRFDEDKRSPVVRITNPPDGVSINTEDEIKISAKAEDPDGEIKYVQFYIGDTLLSTKPKEPFELKYSIGLPDGVYTLRALAEDYAENIAEDRITIIVGEGNGSNEGISAVPQFVEPQEETSFIGVGEIVDVKIKIPSAGELEFDLFEIRVSGDPISGNEVLLSLVEGEGIYVRQWKADKPGKYVIKLVTEKRGGETIEWGSRTINVR